MPVFVCRVPVGQGKAGIALQQVMTSPVLLATLAGIVLRVFQLPVPPTVSPNLAGRSIPHGLPATYLLDSSATCCGALSAGLLTYSGKQ